ncbi:AsnC family transcriptional regulator [Brevibacterium spongiae]|uniref:AsnC family transcriptional regulator n=1 Tax=Brevibacterium spongiae TaxID=2909672 RepID=A0ABY5SU22_9MICO|nr:AsnC family transcriptional regulator [Brevibacterium spongiae]UVI36648.1 AsnC family transcriptional regulator [Brevibacterium spongiae]
MESQPIIVDELDRRILLALIAQPLVPFSQLADRLGASTATIAARYKRLHRQGLVRITGRTLPGFGGRHAYLVRAGSRPDHVAHLASSVAAYDNSRWVRISKDGTELMCGLVTDSPAHDPILTLLPSEALRSLDVHELLHVWGVGSSLSTHPPGSIDHLDEALIAHLAADGRASLRDLARSLQVNASTVSRRRQHLIDSGVLYFEADVHPEALGGTGDAMVWMSLPPGRIRAAGQRLRADSRVRFTAATSGSSDLVAHVHVMDNQTLLAFVDETLADLEVASTTVIPMGRVLKRNAV